MNPLALLILLAIANSIYAFRQPIRNGEVEQAKTICQLGREILWGTEAKGSSPTNVRLHIGCPEGGEPIGIFHTHPKGVASPSTQDISEMLRANRNLGVNYMCISDDVELRCYEVRKRV